MANVDVTTLSAADLEAKISTQGDVVRSLKAEKKSKEEIQPEVEKLIVLKKALGAITKEKTPAAQKNTNNSNEDNCSKGLQIAKGARDLYPEQMVIRDGMLSVIQNVFRRHGGEALQTPVFELMDTLMGKYGEDSKLIYELKDQGGQLLALRYDLTVPFARFMAMNPSIRQMKRFQIDRVYRRDSPSFSQGRYREFVQCDIDFAGEGESMLQDAECVVIVSEILEGVELPNFEIKVNHRGLLDGIFAVCGVPEDLFRPICSTVDKLDKMSWVDVRSEMLEKGLNGEAADRIGEYVKLRGGMDLVDVLRADEGLMANSMAKAGIEDMSLMLSYLDMYGRSEKVVFDLSLARGLDYYTGVIYEAILLGADVGSVAGGGRYDNLVGSLSAKGRKVPCVGVSIGIERLFALLERRAREAAEARGKALRTNETDVLVVQAHNGLLNDRVRILGGLWKAGVKAEITYKKNPKLLNQFQHAESRGIPLCIVLGKSELDAGTAKVKDMREFKDRIEITVPIDELPSTIATTLSK